MKKNNISLFILAAALVSSILLSTLIGCKFDLSESKFLQRPDIEVKNDFIIIRGPYVNSDTKYINIYRQDVTENSDIERIAVLFPKGFDKDNQTYIYFDYNIFYSHEYRYYVRFVEENGSKNRTEWTDKKNNTATTKNFGACSYAYTVPNDAIYTYDGTEMTLKLPAGKTFTEPDAIDDYSEYKPALVFQRGEIIQTYEVNDFENVALKSLLPKEYLYTDVKLLGIVGQRKVYSEGTDPELQFITWTELTPITIKNDAGNVITSFRLEPAYGDNGFDYTIDSDNED